VCLLPRSSSTSHLIVTRWVTGVAVPPKPCTRARTGMGSPTTSARWLVNDDEQQLSTLILKESESKEAVVVFVS